MRQKTGIGVRGESRCVPGAGRVQRFHGGERTSAVVPPQSCGLLPRGHHPRSLYHELLFQNIRVLQQKNEPVIGQRTHQHRQKTPRSADIQITRPYALIRPVQTSHLRRARSPHSEGRPESVPARLSASPLHRQRHDEPVHNNHPPFPVSSRLRQSILSLNDDDVHDRPPVLPRNRASHVGVVVTCAHARAVHQWEPVYWSEKE